MNHVKTVVDAEKGDYLDYSTEWNAFQVYNVAFGKVLDEVFRFSQISLASIYVQGGAHLAIEYWAAIMSLVGTTCPWFAHAGNDDIRKQRDDMMLAGQRLMSEVQDSLMIGQAVKVSAARELWTKAFQLQYLIIAVVQSSGYLVCFIKPKVKGFERLLPAFDSVPYGKRDLRRLDEEAASPAVEHPAVSEDRQ